MNKVILIPDCRGWVMEDLMKIIKGDREGIEIKYPEEEIKYNSDDIIHLGYWDSFKNKFDARTIITVNWIGEGNEGIVSSRIKKLNPCAVIVTCETTKNILKKQKIDSIIIPNPIDLKDFRVGYLGEDSERKRFDIIDRTIEEMGMVNCGIRRIKKEKPLNGKQLERWYRSLNVYVVASYAEGAPMAALEAMACGVPVISTKVGMLADRNDVTFFDGSVEELKERLEQFMFVSQITKDEFVNKHLKLYSKVYDYKFIY